jgi:RNA binding exosome subunit
VTSDIAYYRWHGRGSRPWYDYRYSTEQLTPWIQKVQETMKKVKRTYGFFNNHYHGYAVENCLQVLEMLGSLMPHQAQAKVKIEKYFKDSTALTETKLDSFNQPIESSLESLLRSFSDENRLKRATEIPDEQVSLYKANARIEATVREYHILIDENNRTIEHDCADWGKAVGLKRFCKHVDKLFLMLDRQKAADLLNRISEQKDEWQFKSYTT